MGMLKGGLGLFLFVLGLWLTFSGIFGAIFWSAITITLGVSLGQLCVGYYIFLIIIGAILTFVGARWFFENENQLLRLLLGCAGILLFIAGVIMGLIGIVGAPETAGISLAIGIFSWLMFMALGLSMIDYGFKLHIFPIFDKLLARFKKVLMIKIR
jgi:hypothetical protein